MNPLSNMSWPRRAVFALGSGIFFAGVVVLVFALFGSGSSDAGPPRSSDVVLRTHVPTYTAKPATPTPDVVTAAPAPTVPPAPPLEGQVYRMVIDKLGVNAPVDTYGLDADRIPVVPTGDDARDVVAWWDFSAKPGTNSNAVFGGHVTWFGQAVFYNLGAMEAGDDVKLLGEDGTQVVYRVTEVYRVLATDQQAVDVMYPTDSAVITLITCVGQFVDTGDPVFGGEYSERVVVRGNLESVTPGAVAAAEGAAAGS
jgi:LPXTG-site transpeptidase (sortase) family protein